jgi:hypothetical protein
MIQDKVKKKILDELIILNGGIHMIGDDLDQKDKKESIQHFAHKKRENVGIGGLFLAITLFIIVIAAIMLFLFK